jgi:rubrerythrin
MMTLTGIDFAALSPQDALDLAILVEEEARERYDDFADVLEGRYTTDAGRFFRFMAVNEEKHRCELAARRKAAFGTRPARVKREMIFEAEAPAFDELQIFLTLREALDVALRAEQKAYAFFSSVLEAVDDGPVAVLLAELCEEEIEHQRLVLAELEKLPPESEPRRRAVLCDAGHA